MKITKDSYNLFQKELLDLEPKLIEAQQDLQFAIEQGDGAHDSFLIQEASARLNNIQTRKFDLEKILRNAQIIHNKYTNYVQLGSSIKLIDLNTKSITECILVENFEANIMNNKISIDSPLGKELLNKELNQEFQIKMPNGIYKNFRIIEIN